MDLTIGDPASRVPRGRRGGLTSLLQIIGHHNESAVVAELVDEGPLRNSVKQMVMGLALRCLVHWFRSAPRCGNIQLKTLAEFMQVRAWAGNATAAFQLLGKCTAY